MPNWPQLPTEIADIDDSDDNDGADVADRRSDTNVLEPESPNISWFFEKDLDGSGSLSLSEMWMRYAENSWYNARYQTAIEKLIQAADTNRNQEIDMQEYIE